MSFSSYLETGKTKADPVKKEPLKEAVSEFDAWYAENEADIEADYQEYVKEMERLGETAQAKEDWARDIFDFQLVGANGDEMLDEANELKFFGGKGNYRGYTVNYIGQTSDGKVTAQVKDKTGKVVSTFNGKKEDMSKHLAGLPELKEESVKSEDSFDTGAVTAEDSEGKKFRVENVGAETVNLIPEDGEYTDRIRIPVGDFYEFYTVYDKDGKVISTPEEAVRESLIHKANNFLI